MLMTVNQTDRLQLRGIETLPFNAEGNEKNHSGAGLHQVFKDDCVGAKAKTSQAPFVEEKAPSFWIRIYAWFNNLGTEEIDPLSSSMPADALKQPEPVDLLPLLDPPEKIPADLENALLPPAAKNKSSRQTLTSSEVVEAASLMSQRTIEEIMCIIMKGQIELEKENALVAESTFTKYQNIKKLREKVLEEIKDALIKDEQVLKKCKTVQNVALVASFICGIAAAAVSFGALAPAGAALGGLVGALAGATAGNLASAGFLFAGTQLATYGPVVAAGLTGLATGAKAYSKRRLNEDQGNHEQFSHQDKYTSDRIEDAQERLMTVADADQVFKESLIQIIKRLNKMTQLVMQK